MPDDTATVSSPPEPATRARWWEVVYTLVERSILLRQKRSMLGLVWPISAPLLLTVLYTLVFNRVFEVPIRQYPVYLFLGLLPWNLLVSSVSSSLQSITGYGDVVRRAPFKYQLLPLSIVVTNLLPFLILFTGFLIWVSLVWRLNWVLAPLALLPIVALVLFVSSVAMLVALFDVYNHTLRFVLGNVLTVWFFAVPIVYRPDMAGRVGEVLRSVDPMNLIVGQLRDILYWGQLSRPWHLLLMVVLSALAFVVANTVFERYAPEIPKEL